MSTILCIGVVLGSSKAELTLAAKLYNIDNEQVGDEITTGFTEWGTRGQYDLLLTVPDGFTQGKLKVYPVDEESTCWVVPINPTDIEAAAKGIPAALAEAHGEGNWEGIDSGATPEEIDEALTASHGTGSWQRDAGTGATQQTYTVTDSATGKPLAGVNVRVTTDEEGENTIAQGVTDDAGIFTFYHGLSSETTVYLWSQKAGYTFTNPDTEEIP